MKKELGQLILTMEVALLLGVNIEKLGIKLPFGQEQVDSAIQVQMI